MSDDLVLDAPELNDEVIDQPTDETIEVEGAEDRPEGESEETPQQPEITGDERTLPRWIRDLKATKPDDFRAAKDHFFKQKEIDAKLKDFDLDGIKSWLEESGGRDGIVQSLEEMQTAKAELDGINEAIASGSPELVREMAEAHPESFPQLAQAALNVFAEKHPEDYNRVLSGIFANTLGPASSFLEKAALYMEVGKTDQAVQMMQQLQGWMRSFGEVAAKPAATPVSQRTQNQPDPNQQRLQQVEQERWIEKLNTQRNPMIETALKDYIAMRPESEGTKQRALAAVAEEVQNRLGKDQSFVKSVNSLRSKGDIEGALRLVRSRESRVLEDVAKAIGEDFYGKLKPAAAPVVQRAQQRTQQRPQQPKAPVKPADKFAQIFASA